jgi:hypothetical protein
LAEVKQSWTVSKASLKYLDVSHEHCEYKIKAKEPYKWVSWDPNVKWRRQTKWAVETVGNN